MELSQTWWEQQTGIRQGNLLCPYLSIIVMTVTIGEIKINLDGVLTKPFGLLAPTSLGSFSTACWRLGREDYRRTKQWMPPDPKRKSTNSTSSSLTWKWVKPKQMSNTMKEKHTKKSKIAWEEDMWLLTCCAEVEYFFSPFQIRVEGKLFQLIE